MNSLAIKLDVSDKDQESLNALLVKIGIKPQRRRFHCTVGFIDKLFNSSREAEEYANRLRKILSLPTPLTYHFKEPRFLFRHVIGLVPQSETLQKMRQVNQNLHKIVHGLSQDQYPLNTQTTEDGYHPHITLWRQRHKDRRFQMVRTELERGHLKPLSLNMYSFTVL